MEMPTAARRAIERSFLAAAFACGLSMAAPARADVPAEVPLPVSWVAVALDTAMPEPRESQPDFSAVIESRKSYAIPALEIVGFDFLLNQFDRRYFGCCDFDSNLRTIRRNLRSSWVVDRDPFLVNQLGHPYQGSMYHGFARASGLNYWEGLTYTFLGSAFWEIAGETTPPSRNDQINTGIGGSFLGEALFRMANLALEHENLGAWREVAAALLSPPVGFNRLAFGDRFRVPFPSRGPVYFTRLQLGFSGSAPGDVGVSTVTLRRSEALADFFMDYGLPGKQGYEYKRPFDYFSFQATASSANGFENALTKGLLVGRDYKSGEDRRFDRHDGTVAHHALVRPDGHRAGGRRLHGGGYHQQHRRERLPLRRGTPGARGVAPGVRRTRGDRRHGARVLREPPGRGPARRPREHRAPRCGAHRPHPQTPRHHHQIPRQPARRPLPRHRRHLAEARDDRPLLYAPRPRPLRRGRVALEARFSLSPGSPLGQD
jgi:hypothetical protein